MKFAFIVHPLSEESKALWKMDDGGQLLSHWENGNLLEICDYVQSTMAEGVAFGGRAKQSPIVLDHFSGLKTTTGQVAEGRVYEIPCSPKEILEDPATAIEQTQAAVQMAADWGAGVVGLGSLTSVVGGHGQYIADNSPIPVTTGNSLTVYAALKNLQHACSELDIDLLQETVTVIGIPGSIATAMARMLRVKVGKMLLVARRPSQRASRIASELDSELLFDIPTALAKSRLILSATSSGNCIAQEMLQTGSVVIDVGVPADVTRSTRRRSNVLVVSGGLVDVPKSFLGKSMLLSFHFGLVPGCLAETINLALEDRAESFSLGRDLSVDRIDEIGTIATSHGFSFSQLSSFGRPVADSLWASMNKVVGRRNTEDSCDETAAFSVPGVGKEKISNGSTRQVTNEVTNGHHPTSQTEINGKESSNKKTKTEHKLQEKQRKNRRARTIFQRYINPVLVNLADQGGLNKTFVRGQDTVVTDAEENHYLDFVSGFGSVNLGHNHPKVVQAVREALDDSVPGFSPAAINPHAATLAERLVSIAPAGLEMVFFCNSGTESVESAIKLARIATGRSGIVYCHGSYHGKSLGALSVTGNRSYQQPFHPLVPDCHPIPYGNLEVLERVLASENMAAFIVEPIQGEGGMILPPAGYLSEAERLCRQAGTLLIADEVQTGMGRTGTIFASEQAAIEPDIMTVAKSLSGGLVPIGAMLARRDLWMKAYGTVERFALHTSTFGGGSLACVAGLAAVETLVEERLAENAAKRGFQILEGLNEIRRELPDYFQDIRGQGLMIGVELSPLAESVITHLKRTDSTEMLQYMMQGMDAMIASFPAVFQMQILLEHYHIYTQVTRSNPLVLRIQPPLTIDSSKAAHFLNSFSRTCRLGQNVENLFDEVITRSISGQHVANPSAEISPETPQTSTPPITASGMEVDEQYSQ
jgi:acetylornithine/succinyldiaminopimelate/putrescine aminotransferase/predicted amino acid dehydrogenase